MSVITLAIASLSALQAPVVRLDPALQETRTTEPALFEPPVRLRAAGEEIRVEAPGYAAPAWHDVDGDGRPDLVVGQFNGGKMRVYAGQEDGSLAAGQWLMAGGKVAEVPGVW